jgi:prepilin-type N-terminal cleavage/methylation domain-containing protein
MTKNKHSGFTLLEILLVVGIISLLAGIVIVAINPGRQLAQVRNTQRQANLTEINKAIQQYYIDKGFYPASTTLTTTLTEICATGASSSPAAGFTCTSLINLSELVPTYMVSMPADPAGASSTLSLIPTAYANSNGTGYKVAKNSANKIALSAPLAELGRAVEIGTTTATIPAGARIVSGEGLVCEDGDPTGVYVENGLIDGYMSYKRQTAPDYYILYYANTHEYYLRSSPYSGNNSWAKFVGGGEDGPNGTYDRNYNTTGHPVISI